MPRTLPRCRAFLPQLLATVIASLALLSTVAVSRAYADVTFTITGGGYGHGIGLSQYGAKGYAEKGWPYDDILRWYYGADRTGAKAGVTVQTLASLGKYANPKVKVNIHKDYRSSNRSAYPGTRSAWTLRGWKTRLRISDSSGTVTFLPADEYHRFSVTPATADAPAQVSVAGKTYVGTVVVRPETTASVTTPLTVVKEGSGGYGSAYVRYRGELQLSIYSGAIQAINVVPIEEYLYGVVPRESPSSWHAEALKAQAVAARSYAWGTNSPSSASSTVLPALLHTTTYSQMYCGHSALSDGLDSVRSDLKETPSTNKAVDDTAGQVVYHGPTAKVVTTYFSSSSGGHTANVEDVWTGGSPKPYLVGVPDADGSGNPYYKWAPVTKSGSEIAAAIRDKDNGTDNKDSLDYSAAYPATVTKVTHDRAASGYVRYVTFTWSTGAVTKVSGDTIRSALGLRSTKFTISQNNIWRWYQQTDASIAWAGRWTTYRNSKLSGGSYKYSAANTGLAIFTFKGSGFRWITTKSATGGYGDVYVDGVKVSRVNLYSSTTKSRSTVWSKTGLSADTTHTIIVHVTGKKSSTSRGRNVGVDAVQVFNGTLMKSPSPRESIRFDDTYSGVTYTGAWTTIQDPNMFGLSSHISSVPSSTATFFFIGNRAEFAGSVDPTYGKAIVYFDSRAAETVDAYAADQVPGQVFWESGVVPFGPHSVTVVKSGTKPFGIDYVDVWAGTVVP